MAKKLFGCWCANYINKERVMLTFAIKVNAYTLVIYLMQLWVVAANVIAGKRKDDDEASHSIARKSPW